ncbi:MAG: MerR family transcriptional regulator [Butyrivibrio sp.]|uniref:MerR family transcriptional regulator n=1 Tax=Butyrivibrio sp. TaxID=28121 RepID=UPI001B293FC8|nr:MerR family transcriptional regulator [Butyrivibrio sp.]MBO6240491.1 MerR family transcriptional regulator [Butyrivibrio sp.]
MSTYHDYKNNEQEYSLTVSQFAKLCGTTRDTLRHYYEQDILMPRVDEDNGYHYYSASQISSFFFISTMRQAGCSIKEIRDIIHNSSREAIEKLTNSKILEMQRELYRINKKISALHLGMWILGEFGRHKKGSLFLQSIPELSISRTPVRNKDYAHHAADIANDISVHLNKATDNDSLSIFPTGVSISYDDLIKKHYVYNNIISLSFLPSDNINTFPSEGNLALCCHQDNMTKDIEKTYQKMVNYIKKNRLKACSDLYIISLINLYDQEKEHTYFKYLFIFVKPA